MKDGLFSEMCGRYEQIGYTVRTFDYIFHLTFFLEQPFCLIQILIKSLHEIS